MNTPELARAPKPGANPAPPNIAKEKDRRRKQMMALRALLADEWDASATQRQCESALEWLSPKPGLIVAGYMPIGSECNPQPLMEALAEHGCELTLPVVEQRDSRLIFRQWKPGAPLEKGPHGIAHPLQIATVLVPDLLLVPLLAYDKQGYRLGYGGGYYDRTIDALRQQKPGLRVLGIAFFGQRVEALPVESFDRRLDAIATEHGIEHF